MTPAVMILLQLCDPWGCWETELPLSVGSVQLCAMASPASVQAYAARFNPGARVVSWRCVVGEGA